MNSTEVDLTRKLITMSHLNVAERKALPEGKVRVSMIRSIIESDLNTGQRFPPQPYKWVGPRNARMERKPSGEYTILYHDEVGVYRFQDSLETFATQELAINQFIEQSFGSDVDGVPIDYTK